MILPKGQRIYLTVTNGRKEELVHLTLIVRPGGRGATILSVLTQQPENENGYVGRVHLARGVHSKTVKIEMEMIDEETGDLVPLMIRNPKKKYGGA